MTKTILFSSKIWMYLWLCSSGKVHALQQHWALVFWPPFVPTLFHSSETSLAELYFQVRWIYKRFSMCCSFWRKMSKELYLVQMMLSRARPQLTSRRQTQNDVPEINRPVHCKLQLQLAWIDHFAARNESAIFHPNFKLSLCRLLKSHWQSSDWRLRQRAMRKSFNY